MSIIITWFWGVDGCICNTINLLGLVQVNIPFMSILLVVVLILLTKLGVVVVVVYSSILLPSYIHILLLSRQKTNPNDIGVK